MQLNYYAPSMVHLDTGYGRMAYALLQAFDQINTDVNPMIDPNFITLTVGHPENGASVQTPRMWLFTMIESTRMSKGWVNSINALYERVLVPSPCQVGYLRESGVKVPVSYVPLGVDLYMPYLKARSKPTGRPFTFLTYSYGDNRKGAELAIFAFNKLFKGNPDYRLVIKARENHIAQWLQAIQTEQISIIGGSISNAHWLHLLENADCFVFPSRAEGYGLPPREATLSECPTIATRWLGLWDIDSWGYGIDVEGLSPVFYHKEINNSKESLWAQPSQASLEAHMVAVTQDYDSALEKARQGREYLLAHHTWVGAANAIKHLMERYG
jgi:hypothetical protein